MVIAIILILLSILMPALSRSREIMQRTVCANNLKQLSLGCFMYADENDEWAIQGIPWVTAVYNESYGRYCFDWEQRNHLAKNYALADYRVWWCPRTSGLQVLLNGISALKFSQAYTIDTPHTTGNRNNWALHPYGYLGGNRGISNPDGDGNVDNDPTPLLNFKKYKNYDERIMWYDGLRPQGETSYGWTPTATWRIAVNGHGNTWGLPQGANYVLADGHVEFRSFKNIVSWVGMYYSWR